MAIDAAQIKGVLRLPLASLRATLPVFKNPASKHLAVTLTPEQCLSGDQKSGETNGQGLTAFGGWFALSPAGTQISGQASNSGSGGGGY